MTTAEGFLDYVWHKLGAEAREHAREVDRLLERLPPEDRPKFLASLFWASWCRGRNDHAEGKERYWDMD
jgi:phytoene/squalene synthetase